MSEITYSEKIKGLSRAYYNHDISAQEYRDQRHQLLSQMDYELNGVSPALPENTIPNADILVDSGG